jgi:hypothetical protein
LEDAMIRERTHLTVKNMAGWNEALDLISQLDQILIAAGRSAGTVWTQVAGPWNEMVIEDEYADLATYERVTKAFMSDPEVLKILPRFEEITVPGKGYNELLMTADKSGA